MQMLYNPIATSSQFDERNADAWAGTNLQRGGFEIVDKFARKEIFIEGALAASFELGVQALLTRAAPARTNSTISSKVTQPWARPRYKCIDSVLS